MTDPLMRLFDVVGRHPLEPNLWLVVTEQDRPFVFAHCVIDVQYVPFTFSKAYRLHTNADLRFVMEDARRDVREFRERTQEQSENVIERKRKQRQEREKRKAWAKANGYDEDVERSAYEEAKRRIEEREAIAKANAPILAQVRREVANVWANYGPVCEEYRRRYLPFNY